MRDIRPQDPIVRQVIDSARESADAADYDLLRPFGLPVVHPPGDCAASLDGSALVDPSVAAITVTLPAVTRADVGRLAVIKNHTGSTNTITIIPVGTIDGAASATITTARGVTTCQVVGVDEWITV